MEKKTHDDDVLSVTDGVSSTSTADAQSNVALAGCGPRLR